MNIQETAVAYHTNGCNCAQSVLMALQNETGLDEDTSGVLQPVLAAVCAAVRSAAASPEQ